MKNAKRVRGDCVFPTQGDIDWLTTVATRHAGGIAAVAAVSLGCKSPPRVTPAIEKGVREFVRNIILIWEAGRLRAGTNPEGWVRRMPAQKNPSCSGGVE